MINRFCLIVFEYLFAFAIFTNCKFAYNSGRKFEGKLGRINGGKVAE